MRIIEMIAMMCAAAVATAAWSAPVATTGIPASAYKQDGLIAQWDGIENVGVGLHDGAATVWKDLKGDGTLDLTLNATGKFNDNALVSDGKNCAAQGAQPSNVDTIDFCYTLNKHLTANSCLYHTGAVNGGNCQQVVGLLSSNRGFLFGSGPAGMMYAVGTDYSGLHTVDWNVSGTRCIYDGTNTVAGSGSNNFSASAARLPGVATVGGFGGTDTPAAVKAHSIRLYNRALTAEDVAHNAAVDVARFGSQTDRYRWNATAGKLEVLVEVACQGSAGSSLTLNGGTSTRLASAWVEFGSTVTIVLSHASGVLLKEWLGVTPEESATPGTYTIVANTPLSMTAICGKDTKTWAGAANARWDVDANWSPTGVPTADDIAVVPTGSSVLLAAATPALAFADITGTITCTNWTTCLEAGTVVVRKGGKVTCAGPFATDSEMCRAYLKGVEVTVEKGGSVDVSGMGYKGGTKNAAGCGPGGGASGLGGGSHGGVGSYSSPSAATLDALCYGSLTAPITAGSGGWGGNSTYGGAGGGVVRIEATGRVTVNGTVAASGNTSGGAYSACGAGGSVYISCNTFAGENGVIRANAVSPSTSYSQQYHGAGGGRVAIVYDAAEQAKLPVPKGMTYSADCSPFHAPTVASFTQAGLGTLYFSSDRLIDRTGASLFGRLEFADLGDTWTLDSFRMTNGWATLLRQGVTMNVTGDFELTGAQSSTRRFDASTNKSTLDTAGTRWELGPAAVLTDSATHTNYPALTSVPRLTVGGDLKLTTNGVLYVTSCRTPLYDDKTEPALTNLGAQVTVSGAIRLVNKGRIYVDCDPWSGTSPAFNAASLSVDATSTVNANDKGYFGGYNNNNYPGVNKFSMSPTWPTSKCGGGHGGEGGWCPSSSTLMGKVYDSLDWPLLPGSGGHSNYNNNYGPRGGGVLRFFLTGDAVVDGTISANATGISNFSGGGAGGSVLISCRTLIGAGKLSASGAKGYQYTLSSSTYNCGGGGGGRIAVHYDAAVQPTTAAVTFQAPGGTGVGSGAYSGNGEAGTLWFTDDKLIAGNTTFAHKGKISCPNALQSLTMQSLVLDDGIIDLPAGGYVDIAGDITIRGKSVTGCGLTIAEGWLKCGGNLLVETGYIDLTGGTPAKSDRFAVAGNMILSNAQVTVEYVAGDGPLATVAVGGDVVMTNATTLTIQSPANPTEGEPGCVFSARNLSVFKDCWVYPYSHSTNGASVLFKIDKDLVCATNAGFNATAKGYATTQTGTTSSYTMHNWGPTVSAAGPITSDGRAKLGSSGDTSSGGGYGGAAGQAVEPDGKTYPNGKGWTWGSANRPVFPGVGGGVNYGLHSTPRGGGLVRIEAGNKVLLNGGSLLADAESGVYNHRSGASGGAVYVRTRHFDGGGGTVSAKGGSGNTVGGDNAYSWACPGGGGGRIAIWCGNIVTAPNSVTATAAGGLPDQTLKDNYTAEVRAKRAGADGTVTWCKLGGMTILLR